MTIVITYKSGCIRTYRDCKRFEGDHSFAFVNSDGKWEFKDMSKIAQIKIIAKE